MKLFRRNRRPMIQGLPPVQRPMCTESASDLRLGEFAWLTGARLPMPPVDARPDWQRYFPLPA